MKQVVKDFIKGWGKIGEETGKEVIREAATIGETIISGKELLGDIKPMSEDELNQKRAEDEKKKQEEMEKIKREAGKGRNVEEEIKQVREEKAQEEKAEEQRILEEVKRKREAERMEREQLEAEMGQSNPHKAKKKRGSAFMPGKKQGATDASQSATAEYFKKPD
jgi:hypothetical protein